MNKQISKNKTVKKMVVFYLLGFVWLKHNGLKGVGRVALDIKKWESFLSCDL